jgi:hypothetical protein
MESATTEISEAQKLKPLSEKAKENLRRNEELRRKDSKECTILDSLANPKSAVSQAAAAEYIPAMCKLLRCQHPYLSCSDIKRRILRDCGKIFERSIIEDKWPSWVKEEED